MFLNVFDWFLCLLVMFLSATFFTQFGGRYCDVQTGYRPNELSYGMYMGCRKCMCDYV